MFLHASKKSKAGKTEEKASADEAGRLSRLEGWQAAPEPVCATKLLCAENYKERRENDPQMKQADRADWKAGWPRLHQFLPQRSFVL